MAEKLKNLASIVFGFAVMIGLAFLPFIFIKGAFWASENILPTLAKAGWIALALVFLVLLPLSIFRALRAFTGTAIYLSSYLFGLICWLFGFIITYSLWGIWAIIIGMLFLGVGVVPIAMIASLFKGAWQFLIVLLVLTVLTFGTRIGGFFIAEKGE
jgi:hypothetical protein